MSPSKPTFLKLPKPEQPLPASANKDSEGIMLEWKRSKNAFVVMSRDNEAVVNGAMVHFQPHHTEKSILTIQQQVCGLNKLTVSQTTPHLVSSKDA